MSNGWGMAQNGKAYTVIPDVVKISTFIDAKSNILYVPYNRQMQAMVNAAEWESSSMNLVVSNTATVSPRLVQQIKRVKGCIRRFDSTSGTFSPYN